MGEIIFLLLLAAIGGYYYYESLGYTVGRFDTTGGGGLFPRAILIVLFVLLAARLIEILVKKEKAPFKFFGYLKGVGGVVGKDEDASNELRACEFSRVKGGKPFNVRNSRFRKMLREIGQPIPRKTRTVKK